MKTPMAIRAKCQGVISLIRSPFGQLPQVMNPEISFAINVDERRCKVAHLADTFCGIQHPGDHIGIANVSIGGSSTLLWLRLIASIAIWRATTMLVLSEAGTSLRPISVPTCIR